MFLFSLVHLLFCIVVCNCVWWRTVCLVSVSRLYKLGADPMKLMLLFPPHLPLPHVQPLTLTPSLPPTLQLTFTEAMRNKARLSITGSVGENGRVLTPDCPKAVHSGPSLRHSSGLAVVSSDLP